MVELYLNGAAVSWEVEPGATLLDALRRHEWNKTRAARSLSVTRQGLIKMMHRLELPLAAPEGLDA